MFLQEPAKKYFKRGDLLAKLDEERQEKYGKLIGPIETFKEETCGENYNDLQQHTDHSTLPRKDVIRRLRERGEPILLFSETEKGITILLLFKASNRPVFL